MSIDDFRHEAMAETPSTNIECFARARAGDGGNLWITAIRQTGGRGRRGRSWVSEPGNLYASLLLIDPAPMDRIGSLPLAFALAVYRAIRAVLPTGGDPLEIKWPNDVLIGRRKTCGILMEAELLPDGRRAIVIGIGINIAHKPENPLYPVTMLSEHGASCSPTSCSRISSARQPMCCKAGMRAGAFPVSWPDGGRLPAVSANISPSIFRIARSAGVSLELMIMVICCWMRMRAQGAPSPPATCFWMRWTACLQRPAPNLSPQVGAFLLLMKSRVTDRLRIGPVDQMIFQVRCC